MTRMRPDGRASNQMRPLEMLVGYQQYADGSVRISVGKTHVLCSATVEERVPTWVEGDGHGWVAAEYAMLPRATRARTKRGQSERETEIQRLIGRALRASLDLRALGERMVIVDCDVLQADGGTRTASITGGYVAMALAVQELVRKSQVPRQVWREPVAAISAALVEGEIVLDPCHEEDIRAAVDCDVVVNAQGQLIEVGAQAADPFSREYLYQMIEMASGAVRELIERQRALLGR